jgi:hypothetical protein
MTSGIFILLAIRGHQKKLKNEIEKMENEIKLRKMEIKWRKIEIERIDKDLEEEINKK